MRNGRPLRFLAIVLGGTLLPESVNKLPFEILPIAAFVGALMATFLLYMVASRGGRTSMAIMLLAGIAFAALAGAGTGLLSYISDDRQLRDLTFWSMGSLGGAAIGASNRVGAGSIVISLTLELLSSFHIRKRDYRHFRFTLALSSFQLRLGGGALSSDWIHPIVTLDSLYRQSGFTRCPKSPI